MKIFIHAQASTSKYGLLPLNMKHGVLARYLIDRHLAFLRSAYSPNMFNPKVWKKKIRDFERLSKITDAEKFTAELRRLEHEYPYSFTRSIEGQK